MEQNKNKSNTLILKGNEEKYYTDEEFKKELIRRIKISKKNKKLLLI